MSASSIMSVLSSTKPNFRNDADKIAYAINCVFMVSGYPLISTGAPAFNDDVLTTPISSFASNMDGWDDFEDKFAFVYSTPKRMPISQKKVVVKCHLVNNNNKHLSVNAFVAGSSRPVHHDFIISDFIEQTDATSYRRLYKNFPHLVDCIFKYIVTKLIRCSSTTRKEKRKSQEMENENKNDDKEEKEKENEVEVVAEALEGKVARMCLTDKKRRKKVNHASVSKPYKRRSVKNNNDINKKKKKTNSATAGCNEEHAVTLYDLPRGLYTNMKKAVAAMEYLETHKGDKKASAKLERYEYYIDVLSKFHHLEPVDLPTGWKYDRAMARDVISQCYWEKLSYFES